MAMTTNVLRAMGRQVLQFLDEHHLAHTPDHYAFAYHLLFAGDAEFSEAVTKVTDGGVRIGPKDIERLAPLVPGPSRSSGGIAPQLDALTLRVLVIARAAADTTGQLNRDLVTAMATMLKADGEDLRQVVAAMIVKTASAEASLGEASRRAQALCVELNALEIGAFRDELTGLLNREGMLQLVADVELRQVGFSIALMRVDAFESFNDKYGSAVGNRMLKVIADALHERCSPHPVARWDNETFLMLSENLTGAEAYRVIDATRGNLVSRRLRLRENDKPLGTVSISAGVSSSRSRDFAALLNATDALLQRAISQGGNIVVVEQAAIGL